MCQKLLMRLPTVREFRVDVEVHGFGRGVGIEEVCDSGAGDDDARVAVTRGEDAQASGFEMEAGCVAAAG